VQATLNVLLGERYKVITEEVRNYVRGYYGRPPAPIDPEVKRLAIGDEEPIACRPADLLPPGYEKAKAEIGDLAQSEEDVLSYALFPQVARPFLERRAAGRARRLEVAAAVAAALGRQQEEREAAARAEPQPRRPAISPWKWATRPAPTTHIGGWTKW
jgi:oxaloacetate decarboxylase alpha subunit